MMLLIRCVLVFIFVHLHLHISFSYPYESEQRFPEPIIGGSDADANLYPFFARAVEYFGSNWLGCGGSLITPEFILSAAHCSFDADITAFQIGALCSPYLPGNNCGQDVELRRAKAVFDHPSYSSPLRFSNDFSLIQLESPSTIQPVMIDQGNLSTTEYVGGMFERNVFQLFCQGLFWMNLAIVPII